MKKLETLFEAKRAEFIENLRNTSDVEDLIRNLQVACSALLEEYQDGLTKQQSAVAVAMFDALQLSLDTLSQTIIEKEIKPGQSLPSRLKRVNQSSIIGDAIGSAAIAAFVGGIFGTILGSLAGVLIGNGLSMGSQKGTVEPDILLNADSSKLIVDVDMITKNLSAIFAIIDSSVIQFGQVPEIPKPQIENHPDILEYFQELVGDAENAKSKLPKPIQSRIRQVSGILRKYGIQLEYYQPTMEQDKADSWFEFEPSLDSNLQEAYTLLPALVKGENILLIGRVVTPSKAS